MVFYSRNYRMLTYYPLKSLQIRSTGTRTHSCPWYF